MAQTTTNIPSEAPVEVAKSKKADDVQYIYEASDHVNGIYVTLAQMMRNYGYPAGSLSELSTAFGGIATELGRAASYIVNPSAEDIVDGVKERIRCGID